MPCMDNTNVKFTWTAEITVSNGDFNVFISEISIQTNKFTVYSISFNSLNIK